VLGFKELQELPNLTEVTAAEFEHNLHLVGITAVEDLL
jgi:hypothetical protein